jgi:protein SCO1
MRLQTKTHGAGDVRRRTKTRFVIAIGVMLLFLTGGAQLSLAHDSAQEDPTAHKVLTPEDKILNQVAFEQKLDTQLPLGLEFRNESGKTVQLRQYFNGKPVILMMLYYKCSTLCPIGADMLLATLQQLKPSIGKDFQIVTVSINPQETPEMAADTKKGYLAKYKRSGAEAGWHFLTGDHKSIDGLATAIGFRYAYVPRTGEYAHPDGIVIATPEGRLARYFYRLEYPPRDVQFGLMEASSNRIGSPLTYLALSCFHYNPLTGKYSFSIMKALRLLSVSFVLLCLTAIVVANWRDKHSGRHDVGFVTKSRGRIPYEGVNKTGAIEEFAGAQPEEAFAKGANTQEPETGASGVASHVS